MVRTSRALRWRQFGNRRHRARQHEEFESLVRSAPRKRLRRVSVSTTIRPATEGRQALTAQASRCKSGSTAFPACSQKAMVFVEGIVVLIRKPKIPGMVANYYSARKSGGRTNGSTIVTNHVSAALDILRGSKLAFTGLHVCAGLEQR